MQKLSDLREPPVVGRFYLVPVIRDYPYCGYVGDWPVIGPKHIDAEFFDFRLEHYHVDARFLTASQEGQVVVDRWSYRYSTIEGVVGSAPLCSRGSDLPKGRPVLAKRKCRRSDYSHVYGGQAAVVNLNAHYGAPAQPIRLEDGRLLCPHRKVDLSQFPCDEQGVVTCPLHGLRVAVAA